MVTKHAVCIVCINRALVNVFVGYFSQQEANTDPTGADPHSFPPGHSPYDSFGQFPLQGPVEGAMGHGMMHPGVAGPPMVQPPQQGNTPPSPNTTIKNVQNLLASLSVSLHDLHAHYGLNAQRWFISNPWIIFRTKISAK